MARIRTIKPEFFTSLTITSLPVEARLTFIGLWTHADDEGRCIDDARLIKAALWPLDDRVAADIEADLRALTEASLIVRYRVGDRSFLAVCGWTEHQHINRPSKSKLPAPPPPGTAPDPVPGPGPSPAQTELKPLEATTVTDGASNPHARLTEDSRRERSREQGKEQGTEHRVAETATHADPSPPAAKSRRGRPTDDPDFDRFWSVYPKKADKGHALDMWRRHVSRGEVDPQAVIEGAERYRDDPRRNPDYTKNAGTWLNGLCWEDQPAQRAASPSAWWDN